MPQQTETRLLTGGINGDSAPERLGKDELLNAFNIRSDFQRKALQSVSGNTLVSAVNSLLPGGTNTLLGHCVFDTTLFLLFHNNSGCHILTFDNSAGTAAIFINDTKITSGLGWTAGMYISCGATDDFLVFTDNTADVRYLNRSRNYMAGSAITQGQLSLITEPGIVPLVPTRTTSSGASTIQTKAYQFAYRFITEDGFTSVLSPYSLTSLPTRQSDILANANAGKAINVGLPVTQKIPSNWKRVEFIARTIDSVEGFYVINRWNSNVAADVTAINQHNAATSALTLSAWTGNTYELLDTVYTAKQFDLLPLTSKALVLAANRLILANNVEGYDTPTNIPTVTTSPSTFTANNPATGGTSYTPYMLAIKDDASAYWYFAIIIRIGSKNYLLPKECSIGRFVHETADLTYGGTPPGTFNENLSVGLFNIPTAVSVESLIELKETGDPNLTAIGFNTTGATQAIRLAIVVEANGLTGFVPASGGGNKNWYSMTWNNGGGTPSTILVEVAPSEYGPSSESRAFLPVPYSFGLSYMDDMGRKSGRVNAGTFTPATYTVSGRSFTKSVGFTLPSGVQAGIPNWATNYALTLSNAYRANRFGFFFGGIVKAMFKTGDGAVVYHDPGDLLTVPPGLTIYGIGVPIPSTFNYDYTAGDLMYYSVGSSSGLASVLGTQNGHIVLQFTNDGVMHTLCDGFSEIITLSAIVSTDIVAAYLANSTRAQAKTSFLILNGIKTSQEQYEVGTAFGPITGASGSKTFGNFYTSGTLSVTINGDAHTQVRSSNAGGGTGLAMSPYIGNQSLVWVNDLGRIATEDTVGQKALTNAIRWSNVAIPGASLNGYASFDAGDYETVDATAGDINALILTTRGVQDGGQLLVLCERNSFVGLVDKQELTTADGQTIVVNGKVLSSFNAITGAWGCLDPRSAVSHEGSVWWWDAYHKEMVEFNASGAQAISRHGLAGMFKSMGAGATACIYPLRQEVMFSFPASADTRVLLPTTTLYSPDYPYYPEGYTYCYNWVENKWSYIYPSGAKLLNVQDAVYGFKSGALYAENTAATTQYGNAIRSVLAIPFSANYPATVTPNSVELDCNAQPTQAWVVARDGATVQVSQVNQWRQREGVWQGEIRRNRNKPGSISSEWPMLGINGDVMKTRVPVLILVWDGPVTIRSASMSVVGSSGHLK